MYIIITQQSGATEIVTRRVTLRVADYSVPAGINEATLHSAAEKSPLADADEMALLDSESATPFSLKKITWANVKANVKAFFDALYAPIAKGVTNGDSHDHSGGDGGQISHTNLSDKGTYTHAGIDSHILNLANPHSVTAAQTTFVAGGSILATNVQNAINELDGDVTSHVGNVSNPHSVTAAQVGAPKGETKPTGVIADDSVFVFTPGNASGSIIAQRSGVSGANTEYLVGVYTASTLSYILIGTNTAVASVALTGTTGTDGYFTVSAYGGSLYFENRRGSARNWTFTLLA